MVILGRIDISISSLPTGGPDHSQFRSKGLKGRGGRGMECRKKSQGSKEGEVGEWGELIGE